METDLLKDLDRPCTVMTVFPHPDDESFATGGVLARYFRDDRVKCVSLCLTRGGKSEAMKKAGLPQEREPVIREHEYRASTAILGVDEAIIWDYEDQGLPLVPEEKLRGRVRDAMVEHGADVVITYGPDGITGHVDHRTCSRVVGEAAKEAGVKRLYNVTAPAWMGKTFLGQELLPITHGVDVHDVYGLKLLALRSHASQMLVSLQPMIWMRLMQVGGKEYFHRVF